MNTPIPWNEVKALFKREKHFAVGTVDADGTPRVSPIGSINLGDEGEGHYLECFPRAMRENLDRDPRMCIMAVRGGAGFWLRSLWRGAFPTPPALRLVAEAGPRREATPDEIDAWLSKVRPMRRLKGHDMLWGSMTHARDFRVLRVEPVDLGRMTAPGASPMDDMRAIPGLPEIMDGADHVDVKSFVGQGSMREFLERLVGYEPAWYKALFAVRGVLARRLGLKHDEIVESGKPGADLSPGGKVGLFTTESADEGDEPRWWIARVDDKHLSAWICVAATSGPNGATRFSMGTVVRYNNWLGPLYFNLIRPFHHLVVVGIGRHAARAPRTAHRI